MADEVGVGLGVDVAEATVGSAGWSAGTAMATEVTATALVAAKMLSAAGIEN